MKVCIILALVACVAAVTVPQLTPAELEQIKGQMAAHVAHFPAEVQAMLLNKIHKDPSVEAIIHDIHHKFVQTNPTATQAERCGTAISAASLQQLIAALAPLFQSLIPTAAPTAAPTPAPGRR